MSIKSMAKDIESQVRCLKRFKTQEPLDTRRQKRAIFCGSGDSLASAMLAEAHSSLRARAVDPLDIIKNKEMLKDRDLFLVSVSGRTISNIKAAALAHHSTAITSNPKSKLATACKNVIQLQFPNADGVTAGTISFLESALRCISLVCPVKITSPGEVFDSAARQAEVASYSGRIFFLGNMHTYPISLYAAAKMYEVLGYPAAYERLEQFSHMGLFSARPGDTVVILEPSNAHNAALAEKVESAGLKVVQPQPLLNDGISQFLFYTFFSQLVPLNIARRAGADRCYFLSTGSLLKASNEMIY